VAHNCHFKQNTHSKLQIVHIKFKLFTANTNRSQQIQIPAANTNTVSVRGDLGLRTVDCGLQIKDQGKDQTEGKMQTADCRLRITCRLGVKCRMETADQ